LTSHPALLLLVSILADAHRLDAYQKIDRHHLPQINRRPRSHSLPEATLLQHRLTSQSRIQWPNDFVKLDAVLHRAGVMAFSHFSFDRRNQLDNDSRTLLFARIRVQWTGEFPSKLSTVVFWANSTQTLSDLAEFRPKSAEIILSNY
jgi:hypothetical protein